MKKNRIRKNFLRRFLGEEKGLAMMEYVLLGLLIATACVGAAWAFSRSIKGGMNTMGTAVTTQGQDEIEKAADAARKAQKDDAKKADNTHKSVTGD